MTTTAPTPIKTRSSTFATTTLISSSLFAADTPDEVGGTFLMPGTHFRNVRTSEITVYQHVRGKI